MDGNTFFAVFRTFAMDATLLRVIFIKTVRKVKIKPPYRLSQDTGSKTGVENPLHLAPGCNNIYSLTHSKTGDHCNEKIQL
jgi:hypothetical protein